MFGKKKEQPNMPENLPESLPLGQDLIVHNMPDVAKLSGSLPESVKSSASNFGLAAVPGKTNFKTIGLLIIGAGVIFIGVLVYLSYYFIISPTADKNIRTTDQPITAETVKTEPSDSAAAITETAATVTPAAVATPIPSEIAAVDPNFLPATTTSITGNQALPPLLDSDNDSLFDNEEILLGTSATSTDSDGDGYSDLTEIDKGYNPAGTGVLSDNVNLAEYNNQAFSYRLLYPKGWAVQSLADEATAIFMAPDNSLIQISAQENPEHAGILGWYESAFSDMSATYDQLLSSVSWDGIMGSDSLNFYLTDLNHRNIYVVSYIPAVTDYLAYPHIFKLAINSLSIK